MTTACVRSALTVTSRTPVTCLRAFVTAAKQAVQVSPESASRRCTSAARATGPQASPATRNNHRYGSSAPRAPRLAMLTPKITNNVGPRQHAATSPAAAKAPATAVRARTTSPRLAGRTVVLKSGSPPSPALGDGLWLLFIERLQDGARADRAATRAGGNEPHEGLPHRAQPLDLLLDVGELRGGAVAHVAAGAAGVDAEREQLLDFGEREAERLRVLDEPDDAHRLGLVAAVPVHLACRRAKESPALVVPDRLDVDARGTGELADQERAVCRHAASLHPVLWYKVKRVSGSRTRRRDELLVRPRTREQPGREGRGRAGAIPSQCYARGATPVVLPATDSGASPRSRRRGCETRTACDG